LVKLGASLTEFTVMMNVCAGEVSLPPLATPPLSLSVTVTVVLPLPLGAEVYVSVPAELIAGWTANRLLLSSVNVKLSDWVASLDGPAASDVAQLAMD
jgi:hypothetical protein